ncbi:hypothetical protein GCM10020256_06040 [Streptomyces thermocoprophilus]
MPGEGLGERGGRRHGGPYQGLRQPGARHRPPQPVRRLRPLILRQHQHGQRRSGRAATTPGPQILQVDGPLARAVFRRRGEAERHPQRGALGRRPQQRVLQRPVREP